jgi:hypothetical protein
VTRLPAAGQGTQHPEAMALSNPDWLYHHLHVTGDPGEVAAFRAAAAGAGVIPWQHELSPAED